MKQKIVLAIDQGTTNTKTSLVNQDGTVTREVSCPVEVKYPQVGWVEQDPLVLWDSTCQAIDGIVQGVNTSNIAAIAVTNQRETVLIWERDTGAPAGPAVVWQCRRSAPFCNRLLEQGLEPAIRQRTGLTIDLMFSASKARWLLDHIPDGQKRAEGGELCLGTVDSWILWNLTGGALHACDASNASRTQLFNIHQLEWDPYLLDIFGIPAAILPQVKPSSHIYATNIPVASLPAGIPIASSIGDSHAALYGHAGFRRGAVKATYGTGSSLMTPTPSPVISDLGLSGTVAWGGANKTATYALEGNIYATGAAVQWLGQLLNFEDLNQVESLARQADGSGGVYFVPAFVGLGAPYWKEAARGLITGITRGTSPAQMARATLEAITYQIRDVFDAMQAEVGQLSILMADGGATRNELLMQLQADILGVPVLRSMASDVSALGAAYLAGLATGLWASEDEVEALPRAEKRYEPQISPETRASLYAGWQSAIARTIFEPQ